MARAATTGTAPETVTPATAAGTGGATIDLDDDDLDVDGDLATDNIIKDHMMASIAASIVPVAFFDIAAVVVIQLRMIKKLSHHYDKPFSESQGRKVIIALAGGVLGYGAGYVVAASATKLIPGIGWMIGMVSLPVVAGASTYAVGQSIIEHYEEGGTLLDFSAKKRRAFYDEQFENGKKFARRMREKAKAEVKELDEELA